MGILLYQLMIVGSLFAVRLIAPRRLLPACLIWSALTLFNVFWPPLMVIQLLVIWITYGTIQPAEKKSAPSNHASGPAQKTASARNTATGLRPVTFGTPEPLRPAPARSVDIPTPAPPSLIATLRDWDDRIARTNAINTACAPLLSVCFAERLRIEKALERARPRLAIERKKANDPNFAALYDASSAKARETMTNIDATLNGGAPQPALESIVCGDLTAMPRHPDVRVQQGIREKIEAEIASYAAFLSTLVRTLKEPGLTPVFQRSLTELKAADLLRRISAFEKSGVDWRNPADFRDSAKVTSDAVAVRAASGAGLVTSAPLTEQPKSPSGSAVKMVLGTAPVATPAPRVTPRIFTDTLNRHETVSNELEAAAKKRGILRLVHFTHADNLESILRHGLCSVSAARMVGLNPKVNDKQRLDGHPWSISLSIAAPNHKMFYKYRMLDEHENWVVLLIDRAVLWQKDCAFYPRNAADHRMRDLPLDGQKTVKAFESMYDALDGLPTREAQHLNTFDPTDSQAEVLVFDRIEPSMIEGVAFENAGIQARNAHFLGPREALLYPEGKGFFGSREFMTR
ncbi:DarT ssDNA thymidine ADP-ribosyltransferase family protein [Paraburkholderia fungorum]|nr:DarT ssDNA thymidine ADP-ribosyltransferase family protein [Paraburkholderia fungorum]